MIYFDNAATTPMHTEVIQHMHDSMKRFYGNPSSVHQVGREAKIKLEEARRNIASFLGVNSNTIYFTSGATEATSIGLQGVILQHEIKTIITSKLEHSAVLKTIKHISEELNIDVHYLKLNQNGEIDLDELDSLLKSNSNCLVALMHANNVFGHMNPIEKIGDLCNANNALYFCDTVQSMGKYEYENLDLNVDIAVCSAHKFHGPKGVGFLYLKKGVKAFPLVFGGDQEKALRSGTENLHAILGMSKAFDLAYKNLEKHQQDISELKFYLVEKLKVAFPKIEFTGNSDKDGLYNLINFSLPIDKDSSTIQFYLDKNDIAISTGSACSSGAVKASPAVEAIRPDISTKAIRVSLSIYNTKKEIDAFMEVLKKI